MKYSLCIDLLYLEIGEHGPVFSDTDKLLAGMELAKKTGYQAVEFWDWNTRDYEKLLSKKKELGLDVAAICAKDRGKLTDLSTLDQAEQGLRETIEVAKKFACPNIIITADPNPELSREVCHQNIIESLKRLAPLAEEADIMLVLEPISGASYFIDSKEPFDILRETGSTRCDCIPGGNKSGVDMVGPTFESSVRVTKMVDGKLKTETTNLDTPVNMNEYDINHWIDAIQNDGQPAVLPEQAAIVTRVIEAIYESAATGKTIVFD